MASAGTLIRSTFDQVPSKLYNDFCLTDSSFISESLGSLVDRFERVLGHCRVSQDVF